MTETSKVAVLNTSSFDTTINDSSGLWLIEFGAEWCGPCKAMVPVLEQMAAESDSIQIGRVDVGDDSELGKRFDVTSLPTLVIFRNAEPLTRMYGAKTRRQMDAAIDRLPS
ncbi:thioredoxin family protein [Rhodococcoides fascians]|uniref:thioredoxin family protein n=1 Tax=Rhodococcoides fascians TaxID=1828 RepID=UPI00050C99C1|nr:thioredoxin family protein [Rhodococcus fascians]